MPELAAEKTILIIEDDKFLRDIIVRHLNESGYRTITAVTGEEALRFASEAQPNLIIVDIVLSGISGLDVMDSLAQNDATKNIPFIIFSNSDESVSINRSKTLGAVKYLVKALSTPEQIVHEIQEYFTHSV